MVVGEAENAALVVCKLFLSVAVRVHVVPCADG